MTPERWQEVERLYHSALERPAHERHAFLAEACANDHALRAEVSSLLAQETLTAGILDHTIPSGFRTALSAELEARSAAPGRQAGRMLGAYRLDRWIATGGMGEVYRATDTRLNRSVAIKILSGPLADGPVGEARLREEARIVSSLNHPHICTIHDVGSDDGLDFIVMELIEGETLLQRLSRGPMSVTRALTYFIQIVAALEKVHRRGIVHRDLKPSNVMVTATGVKVLDFGIATRSGGQHPDATPLAMATRQYASTEQLEGRAVDARTDIFSAGLMAGEMLTGRPGWTLVPAATDPVDDADAGDEAATVPGVPVAISRTVTRCLARDPADRWQSASDLLFQLRSLARDDGDIPASVAPHAAPVLERAVWAALLAAALLLPMWLRGRATPPPASQAVDLRFDVAPAADTSFATGVDVPFALSPDGRALAYVAVDDDGVRQLWLRRFDGAADAPLRLAGTEEANTPFWSPDGEWLSFFRRRGLFKLHVRSGRVQPIADGVSTMAGAAWSKDGVILFAGSPRGLSRVSADGGSISAATGGDGSHFWPQFLPDGRHFLYAAAFPSEIRLGSLDEDRSRVLVKVAVRISTLAYAGGYLFYGEDSSLVARAFDPATGSVGGELHRLVPNMPITQLGRTPFSVSAGGPLAFWRWGGAAPARLAWFTADGEATVVIQPPAHYVGLTLSPDGREVAYSRRGSDGGADVWTRDLGSGAERQLTFAGVGFAPRWSPAGNRLAYTSSSRIPAPQVISTEVGSKARAVQVGTSSTPRFAAGWTRDGQRLLTVWIDPDHRDDVYLEDVTSGEATRLPFDGPANEYQPALSPDNRWIAYVTDESGRDEVWLADFPAARSKARVSMDGGTSPQWIDDGNSLAYISRQRQLTSRGVSSSRNIQLGAPRERFDARSMVETTPLVTPSSNAFVSAPDGRVLALVRARDAQVPPIQMMTDWHALIARH